MIDVVRPSNVDVPEISGTAEQVSAIAAGFDLRRSVKFALRFVLMHSAYLHCSEMVAEIDLRAHVSSMEYTKPGECVEHRLIQPP